MTSFPRKHAHAENNSPPPRRCCVPAEKKKKKKRPSEAQLQRFRLRRAVPLNRAFPEKRLGFIGTTARSHVRLSEYGMFMFQFGGNAALSLVIDRLMVTSASVFSKSSARVAVNA